MQLAHAIGKRRWPGLQNDRRLDLVQLAVAHRRYTGPPGSRSHRARVELLAAPGAEDQIGRAPRDLQRIGDDSIAPEPLLCELRAYVVATRDANQLRYQSYAGDLWLDPFLEVDTRPARRPRCGLADRLE